MGGTGRGQATGRVVVVSGPTASGKSTAIERLRGGELPELERRLELHDLEGWAVLEAYELAERGLSADDEVFLHYDLNRIHFLADCRGAFDRDPVLRVLSPGTQIDVVTLWEDAEELCARINARIRKELRASSRGALPMVLALRIRRPYRSPQRVTELYRKWVSYWDRQGHAAHWFLVDGNPVAAREFPLH